MGALTLFISGEIIKVRKTKTCEYPCVDIPNHDYTGSISRKWADNITPHVPQISDAIRYFYYNSALCLCILLIFAKLPSKVHSIIFHQSHFLKDKQRIFCSTLLYKVHIHHMLGNFKLFINKFLSTVLLFEASTKLPTFNPFTTAK